ncbi:hypothetical protein [Marinobacter salarius]|jgi:hypothetical protein|uniref:hypothetical protein n=1 Tax=Marinobacter salarius TaxID=1420917 RepID=UPI0005694E8F|nr:hypothetical protein [Marinobacter salarius]AZR43318.1 hypothetical protein MTMN5_03891 [Marinobacter salarius]
MRRSDEVCFRTARPGKNVLKWLSKEARSKFLKTLAENKEHYTLCVEAAAYRMAQRFHMAALGV